MNGLRWLNPTVLLVAAVTMLAAPVGGQEVKVSEPFRVDGVRYIKEMHKDVNVHMFWNNGVRGKGRSDCKSG